MHTRTHAHKHTRTHAHVCEETSGIKEMAEVDTLLTESDRKGLAKISTKSIRDLATHGLKEFRAMMASAGAGGASASIWRKRVVALPALHQRLKAIFLCDVPPDDSEAAGVHERLRGEVRSLLPAAALQMLLSVKKRERAYSVPGCCSN